MSRTAGLTLIGVFAEIYHPVGDAMPVAATSQIGRTPGINGVYGGFGFLGACRPRVPHLRGRAHLPGRTPERPGRRSVLNPAGQNGQSGRKFGLRFPRRLAIPS